MGRVARFILSDPAPRRAVWANGPRADLTHSAHSLATPPSVCAGVRSGRSALLVGRFFVPAIPVSYTHLTLPTSDLV